jgi:hypothetical protein
MAQVIRAASAARSSGEPAGAHLTKRRSALLASLKVSASSFSQANAAVGQRPQLPFGVVKRLTA